MEGKRLANKIIRIINQKKGIDPVMIDTKKLTPWFDYMVIASSDNKTHLEAVADEIIKELKSKGNKLNFIEGLENGEWIVLDFGSVIVHLLLEAKREYYSIERLWEVTSQRTSLKK